jgi:hypothetical protein
MVTVVPGLCKMISTILPMQGDRNDGYEIHERVGRHNS